MSALAIPALGIANRAAQALPALFADLAARSPAADMARLESTGHSQNGRGAGTYISDALCDAALLSAHPRFVFATASGSIFRLLPEAGSLSVEQGGAAGNGITDDQPVIQAAIDYAHAVSAREVRFESTRYRIDCPLRTSPADAISAGDGHPIVIRKSIRLCGCAPTRTVLDFRALDGADPETDYQLVATSDTDPALAVWRGGGIFLQGDETDPGTGQRSIARFELDRLILQGNRQHTGAYTFPADPITGDGWDVTDRGLWLENCFAGEIHFHDTDMIGWKGEIFYLAGHVDGIERLELHRCRFATGNGSAINPSCDAELLAVDCSFGDCFQAQEDVSKTRAIYRNCTWHDCDHMALGSGATDGVFWNFAWPTRDETAPPPVTLLENCEFRDIRSAQFTTFVRGTIRTIDTTVRLDGNVALALRDTDLSIESWLDRKTAIHALTFDGVASLTEQVDGAQAGIYKLPPSNVRIRIAHHSTALAKENAREWLGCYWTGYIDRSCSLHVEGDYATGRVPNGGVDPLSMPRVTFGEGAATSIAWARGWHHLPEVTGSGVIAPASPLMSAHMGSGIIADMTLRTVPAGGAEYGYVEGQRIRILKHDATGQLRFVKGASTSFAVRETRVLANPHDWIEFSYNRDWQRWVEEGFFSDA